MFAAFDGGMIDHLSTSFASLGQMNIGTAGSLDIDGLGNLYVGDTTGVLVFPEICSNNALPSGDAFDVDAGLADIQGVEAVSAPERLLIVDSSESAPALVGVGRDDTGTSGVLFRTTNLGGKRPWDLDYDPASDRLYVTTTDGNVLVFDNYFERGGAVPPSRMITPFDASGAQQVSLDLRGIVYVPSYDTLILSDVGGTVDPNDGQLLIIDGASAANGNVPVRAQIKGSSTLLGDPSDIAFDGTSLYVAENFNGFLLRYDNILAQSGVLDLEANSISNAPSVRSVTLALQNPGGTPICSPAIAAASTPMQTTSEMATSPPTPLETSQLPTQDTALQAADNAAPPSQAPPDEGQIPPTQPPPTSVPPTQRSLAQPLPTQPPPTSIPPTQIPPTTVPPTTVPPTSMPPTEPLPTTVSPTTVPPTPTPTSTSVPSTPVPPTQAPPTQPPPTPVPPTQDSSGPGSGDDDNSGPGGGGMGRG
jgi:hypothetical protein